MKQYWILATPLFVPILFGVVYFPLNRFFLIKTFGCGCKHEGISANHITAIVFLLLLTACIALICTLSRKISGLMRWGYIGTAILIEICITSFVMMTQIWQ